MSDDQFDRSLHQLAHSARADVERTIDPADVEAALSRALDDSGSHVRLVSATPSTQRAMRRWAPLAAAAAVVAIVVGAAVALSGGDDQVTTESIPVTTIDVAPSTVPSVTTVPPVTSVVATSVVATSVTPSETTAPPATTATPTTTTTTSTTLPPAVDMIESLDEVPYERYLPQAQCLEDDCAQIAYDASGAAWTFRQGQLTNHSRGGAVIDLPEPWASVDIRDIYLLTIGPDDVAYFYANQPPESADLVGISLAAPDAGVAVRHLVDALDFSGDTDYVATPIGLVKVGCCGVSSRRPSPDAELLTAWFERAAVQPPLPAISFNADDASITRDDMTWSFDVAPEQLTLRGMPRIIATHDGGVIGRLDGLDGADFVVRGWPDGTSSTTRVLQGLSSNYLSPEGFVILVGGEGLDDFLAADLFADHPLPTGEPLTIDFESGVVTLDNGWQPPADTTPAARLGRAVEIAGPVSLGARRTVMALDAEASIVVVTTEGLFDDSVLGVQFTVDFVDETVSWANTCQAGRGHQDYQAALCV